MASQGTGIQPDVKQLDIKKSLDIVLKEYEHRFHEIGTCLQYYHRQADYLKLSLLL